MSALVSYDPEHEDDPGYNSRGEIMSRNQLAEQYYAYKLWPLKWPHTINRGTADAALRKEFRL